MTYLYPTEKSGAELMRRGLNGPVTMLNLIRLREVADYDGFPELAPAAPISGRAAYDLYIRHTLPFLDASGGALEFIGEGADWLIGPETEYWHLALLVRQKDLASFMAFEQNPAYMKGLGHRQAAIEDSRLMALSPFAPDGPGAA